MMKYENINDENDEFTSECFYLSTCCGKPPIGEINEDTHGYILGICADCGDNATFEKDTEDEQY